MFTFVSLFALLFFPQTLAHFSCANGGVPFSDAEIGATDSAFSCQCPEGYFGTFCEFRMNSADAIGTTKSDQQQQFSSLVDKFGILFPPGSVSVGSDSDRRSVVATDWHWQDAIVNLLVCVFFLLILPSLVVYIVRILYLFLKRCHHRNRTMSPPTARPMAMPTPPPQYYPPPMGNNFQFRPNPSVRHRSESPGFTEVTVQLPASVCREMLTEQRRHCENQSLRLAPFAVSAAVPPVEPPPNYESALLLSSPRP
ncbi:hypothetical protein niasHT_003127 [Heterodera trifolii]|uniref:EGF-like domain-containing protein n=1 Tax=Heterodera trifolii TaxID=157864 RepID=A0ABD2M584_9BILA